MSVGFARSLFHFLSRSLRALVEEDKTEADGFPFQRNLCVDGQVKDLSLTVGQSRVLCSFAVIGEKHDFKRLTVNRGLNTFFRMFKITRLSSILTSHMSVLQTATGR